MGGKGGGKVMMALGVVLALISGGVVFFMASANTGDAKELPRKQIVMTKNEIPERTIITAPQVELVAVPQELLPPGFVEKVEDVVGKYAKEKINPRMPVLGTQVQSKKPGEQVTPVAGAVPVATPPANTQTVPPAFTLEKGKTIVAVDYPEASKLLTTGLLRVGDKVDIYVRTPGVAGEQLSLLYPNMEIQAIGNLQTANKPDTAPPPSPTLIFVVSPQDALVLKFIESMNPFLLLRSVEDGTEPRATDRVDQDYISRRFNIPIIKPTR